MTHTMTNTIEITCPKCQRELRVHPDLTGSPVVCEECQYSFHPKVTIPCPQCRRSLQVRREYLGKRIFCSYCKCTFKAAQESQSEGQPAAPQWATPGPIYTPGDASKLNLLESELEKLRADLSARTAEHATAMLTLQQTRGQVQQLQGQLLALQAKGSEPDLVPVLQKELAGLHTECGVLRAQLHDAQAQTAEKDQLVAELRAAQAEAARLQQELQDARAPQPVLQPPELELLRTERDRLQAELDTLRTELATRIADSEALIRVQLEGNVLREECDALRARQQALEQELTLERQGRLAAAEQFHAEVQERDAGLAEARATAASLQARLAQEQESQRAEREHLHAQGQTQRQELDQLRARLGELEQALAQAASSQEALKLDWERELTESRARIETERQSYLAEVEQTRTRLVEVEETLAEVRATSAEEASRHASELQALQDEREQLRSRAADLTREVEWLRMQVQDLQQMPEPPVGRDLIQEAQHIPEPAPSGDLILTADAIMRAIDASRGQWDQGQASAPRQPEPTPPERTEEIEQRYRNEIQRLEAGRQQLQQQLDALARQLEADRTHHQQEVERYVNTATMLQAELDAAGQQTADLAELKQIVESLQGDLKNALAQVATLTQERDRLAAECASIRTDAAETEARLRSDLDQLTRVLPPEPVSEPVRADDGIPLPKRYLELAEEVRSLRAQVERGQPSSKSSAKVEKGGGWLGKVLGLGGATADEPGENSLGRRLDTLRSEAMAERERLLLAEADEARTALEQQLAEARAQLQEAQMRADRLETEMLQNQTSGGRYRPGARYDAAHEAPYGQPSTGSGTPTTGQWRLDELT